jgi:hypothetical protein
MYAVIRRYQDVSVDEVMRRIEAGWAPLIRQAPGLIAYYAVDAGGGSDASISLFEDRARAESSARDVADWVRENLGSLSPNPAQVTAGEVRVLPAVAAARRGLVISGGLERGE